jgi:Phage QLRG family, putative DNA packaging.
MKINEITEDNLINYLRLSFDEIDEKETNEVKTFLETAKEFIYSYTGLTPEEADKHEDFTIAVFVLVQDMYDNRAFYIDKNNLNKVVETILNMHRKNLV